MFRVVFLGSSNPVPPDEIEDDRVIVVAPSGEMSPELRPVAREAAALRETRAGYAVSSDPAFSRLAQAIELRENELATQFADSMGRRWANGAIIARGERADLSALLPTLVNALDQILGLKRSGSCRAPGLNTTCRSLFSHAVTRAGCH